MADIMEFKGKIELKDDIKALREELVRLVEERDNLIYTACPNIKMRYMLEAGYLEYKLYELSLNYQRLKRKKELIQAKVYKEEKVSVIEIDEILEKEFEKYKEDLEKKLNEVNESIKRSEGKFLSDVESEDLKDMYRKVVKKLHPDLNPEVTEAEKELFVRAVEAYKAGDVASMKLIYVVSGADEEKKDDDTKLKTLLDMAEEKARLEKLIENIKKNMDEIKSRFPYTLKIYLDDEELMKKKQDELNESIKDYENAIKDLDEAIAKLLEEKNEWFS